MISTAAGNRTDAAELGPRHTTAAVLLFKRARRVGQVGWNRRDLVLAVCDAILVGVLTHLSSSRRTSSVLILVTKAAAAAAPF